jgi:hypothetical protein
MKRFLYNQNHDLPAPSFTSMMWTTTCLNDRVIPFEQIEVEVPAIMPQGLEDDITKPLPIHRPQPERLRRRKK